ncbi:MAG: discoidin domain-containing protein [Prevotellaceae bacterium]|jgi:hypothetical protein|nr:discoidin domain-containing protein [Prevotellaceae bacterium]
MNKIYSNLTPFAVSLLCMIMFACDGFMDVHKKYIEDGEIIYAPKVDSMLFVAGRGRILFNGWFYSSPNVKTVDIYWNSRHDSIIISPPEGGFSSERDSLSVIIQNIREGSYTFDVRTTDNFGHKSLWKSSFGNSYDSVYLSRLSQRRVREQSISDKGGKIIWFSGGDGLMRVEVRYKTVSNDSATVYVPADESETLCENLKAGSKFVYRSLYIPEEHSIDTFATSWTEYATPFSTVYIYDRSDWEVLSVSDETASDGGGKNTLIDNDLDSFWHSQWEGGDAPLPHWAVIDMKSPKKIGRIETYRRKGNDNSKSVRYFVSSSPDAGDASWTEIASGTFSSGDKLTIDIPESVDTRAGRYLKLLLPDSNREPFTSIAEIYLYGIEEE